MPSYFLSIIIPSRRCLTDGRFIQYKILQIDWVSVSSVSDRQVTEWFREKLDVKLTYIKTTNGNPNDEFENLSFQMTLLFDRILTTSRENLARTYGSIISLLDPQLNFLLFMEIVVEIIETEPLRRWIYWSDLSDYESWRSEIKAKFSNLLHNRSWRFNYQFDVQCHQEGIVFLLNGEGLDSVLSYGYLLGLEGITFELYLLFPKPRMNFFCHPRIFLQ